MNGKRVVVVEDVTTTGGSAIKAAEAVRAEGAEVVGVVTVIDRQEGAGEAFAAAGLTLTPILTLEDFNKDGRCVAYNPSGGALRRRRRGARAPCAPLPRW